MTQIVSELKLGAEDLFLRLQQLPDYFAYRVGEVTYAGAFPDATSHLIDPSRGGVEASTSLHEIEVPKWVGVLPYETFRGIERGGGVRSDKRPATLWQEPCWKSYPALVRIEAGHCWLVGKGEGAVSRLAEALSSARVGAPVPASLAWASKPEAAELHRERIERALAAIARGDLYQVNLARRFEFHARGGPLTLLRALEASGPAPFGAALSWGSHAMISLSPELFLEARRDGTVITRPIKGTRPRTGQSAQDQVAQAELESSEKERAELTMVVDLERNDLGRLARVGSVQLSTPPRVVAYPTVFHREAEVQASLPDGTTWTALLDVMCPSGSVTGAPKVSAMGLIAQLEEHRRGLYTGALGFVSSHGTLHLSMAIRTLSMGGDLAHYYSGGGIVSDSDPQQEVEETLWKAEQLSSLISLGEALL